MSEQTDLQKERSAYWRKNLQIIGGCLAVWAIVSFGLGIVLGPALNNFSIGGYPLGFWFAQQGSIYTFLIIIFFYAWRMNKLDKEFNVDEE
ncbi:MULTISPECIES: DUF4212 domain-containing protein [Aquisalimonas]|uniref:Putative solute:sodium symporter small subunit n=1 Tax=Aquisalimonas asiatica TaxID=406100 RepID=A0A1H8Q531_9GAMM|nr:MULTISPECIES: DUF4212 domain-containing protein [Aquisalimonas]SEO48873.1 putative solute:sodium symporter small subunit [Aquisalimonas asiatica]